MRCTAEQELIEGHVQTAFIDRSPVRELDILRLSCRSQAIVAIGPRFRIESS